MLLSLQFNPVRATLLVTLSVSIWFLGDQSVAQQQGIFVGLWVPSILTLGTYFCPACNKASKEWPEVKDS